MQSALPARFPLADTKCTLSRAPDQEREIESTEKIICLQPAHASDCCGCCRPRLGLVRREGDAAETLRRAHTTGGVVTEIMVFRRSALTWRFAPLSLSCARTLLSFSFFFCLWDCVRLRFRFRLPTLFRPGGGSARTKPPTQTHVKRAKNANFPCPYRASFAFHGPTQGNGPAELQVASERSLALFLSRLLRFARTILSRGHVRPLVVAELWKSRGRSDHRAVISCIVSSFRFKNGSCEYAFCFISLFKTIFIL